MAALIIWPGMLVWMFIALFLADRYPDAHPVWVVYVPFMAWWMLVVLAIVHTVPRRKRRTLRLRYGEIEVDAEVEHMRGYWREPYDQRRDVSPRYDGSAGLDCPTTATA